MTERVVGVLGGILESTAVQVTRVYDEYFEDHNVTVIFPEDSLQAGLLQLIQRVKAGLTKNSDAAVSNRAAMTLIDAGALCLIVACTELSVVADRLQTDLRVLDAAQVLAEHIVERAR